ncbi:D-alanyl-D-alanine carboxypeptidase family protein [Pseudalkalibacillus hwajinpoensis]|uniref:D-alanyl-D-alanine carboxypeptidase family protein n=1 Tax=Guptibacillus hwajinpoensis TaxID=208199 RepID=UPI00325BDFC8
MIRKQKWLLLTATYLIAAALSPILVSAEGPDIQSESAVLMDGKTGQILYDKNGNQEMYPASITKIVTALMAVESGKLNESATVSQNARDVDGTRVYLEEGETVVLEKLVKGMMVNSGNDAAIAIAEHLSGSVQAFAEDMNTFVKEEIGVENSHFTNPHGLFNENHVVTAEDMAKITQYAMKNNQFRSLAGIEQMDWSRENWDTTLINHHRLLLDYDYVTGGKNGYVSQSGFTLVTTAEKDNRELIAVTIKANDDQIAYQDTLTLLNYGFDSFSSVVYSEGTELGELNGKKYSLTEDVTLLQDGEEGLELEMNEAGELESKASELTSTLDSDLMTVTSVEEDASDKSKEATPAVQVKDEDTEAFLTSHTIFYGGISIFAFILLMLIFGRSKSTYKRSRSFP